jgi:hypothetical protein
MRCGWRHQVGGSYLAAQATVNAAGTAPAGREQPLEAGRNSRSRHPQRIHMPPSLTPQIFPAMLARCWRRATFGAMRKGGPRRRRRRSSSGSQGEWPTPSCCSGALARQPMGGRVSPPSQVAGVSAQQSHPEECRHHWAPLISLASASCPRPISASWSGIRRSAGFRSARVCRPGTRGASPR